MKKDNNSEDDFEAKIHILLDEVQDNLLKDVTLEDNLACITERYLDSLIHKTKYASDLDAEQLLKLNRLLVSMYASQKKLEPPPKIAEFLVCLFVNKDNRDAILGDLEEEYRYAYNKFGLKEAQLFYCWQVFWSLWPLISASLKKLFKLFVQGIVTKFSSSK